ncbi:MAG TPA: hypothetical protein VGA88_12235 [Burkholderiales bacterium]|jgi:hypothetical protein
MFSELPKLLGREFAIGYFLPVLAIAAGGYIGLDHFGLADGIRQFLSKDVWAGTTLAVAVIWLSSLAAMAVNRTVIRVLEGYGTINPIWALRFFQCHAFDRMQREIEAMASIDGDDSVRRRARLEAEFAARYPSRRDLVLATAFGNTIRAFEDYPRVIYGFDSIEGWDRLVAIVPPPYREMIDAAKTKVDFSANIWFGALLLAAGYVGLALAWSRLPSAWYPLAALAIAWLAARSARANAYAWGVTIKSAIDVFLPELATKMSYRLPAKASEQRKFWRLLSQVFLYRDAPTFSALDKYRTAPPVRTSNERNSKRKPKR